MSPSYRIEIFHRHASVPAGILATLHAELLPRSPLAKLGLRFMERFYYTDLPRQGYIFGAVAYVENAPAGFIVATDDSNGFMKNALRRLWNRLVLELGLSIVLTPRIIGSLWEVLTLMRARETVESRQPEGEILSMGVLPVYQESLFVRKTGLHIANDLFQKIMEQLQTRSLAVVRAVVDADNKPAQFFYHGMGWRLETGNSSGWKESVVEFVWSLGNTNTCEKS